MRLEELNAKTLSDVWLTSSVKWKKFYNMSKLEPDSSQRSKPDGISMDSILSQGFFAANCKDKIT